MRQIVQNYRSGELKLEEVPAPVCRGGGALVRSAFSLVSAGTERMKVTQARMSLLQKARARPDKVRQVLQSVRQAGLGQTLGLVRERLGALTPLGYSLSGVVEEVGAGVDELGVGQRVACAGEKIACHAEFVFVPRNLCVPVPAGVDLRDAAFATVGAIAMQGVRQAQVALGETVVVVGLGLVGLLGVQILKAAGCRVVGVDVEAGKVALARRCGADAALRRDDPSLGDAVAELSAGAGADAVYIAASTQSTDPMHLAGRLLRDRGRVAVVGMIRMEADWQTYYQKELSVVMSRSYGPGRYDRNYEVKGIDYPVGYVRWTERRNMAEFLRLLADGRVRPALLEPVEYDFANAPAAYEALQGGSAGAPAMLFRYGADAPLTRRVPRQEDRAAPPVDTVGIGLIGAGNFATGTLIPAIKAAGGARLRGICSAGGLSASSAAARHGFEYSASDARQLLEDPEIHAVVIATRHDTHARFAVEALRAGKHVFVEKPLALTSEQLGQIAEAREQSGRMVVPGFNRRFSSLTQAVREFFGGRASPIEVICRVNAGAIKADSWYQDDEQGGWRIVSEGCHFVDLIQALCGCQPVEVFANMIRGEVPGRQNDNCMVIMRMADGSLGMLTYVANGDPCFEKERIEVFGQGRTGVIENWRRARLSADGKRWTVKPSGAGKGHREELAAFVQAVRTGGAEPLPFHEALATTTATFAITESLRLGRPVTVQDG